MMMRRWALLRLMPIIVSALLVILLFAFKNTKDIYKTAERLDTAITDWLHFCSRTARFDDSRRYLIHDFVQRADSWPESQWTNSTNGSDGSVCLATQTSMPWLHHLVEASVAWSGPMSVAVFAPDVDFHLFFVYVQHLRRCHASVRDHATFHLMYPRELPPRLAQEIGNVILSCETTPEMTLNVLTSILANSTGGQEWRHSNTLLFPQNHLRNVARKGCPTKHVFLTDVDIVPRAGLHDDLTDFLHHPPCEKCAFVVPTYEVDSNVTTLPAKKSALVTLARNHLAQPFHLKVFSNNQHATNSTRWEALPVKEEAEMKLDVAYPVKYDWLYEPFYVAQDDIPVHDERFLGYGYTRNSQVLEMHMAGFELKVLDNAFAMHRGLLKKNNQGAWRKKQVDDNLIHFKKFKEEIETKYKKTKKEEKKKDKDAKND